MSHICLWSWRFAAVQMGAWFGLMQAVYTSIHIYREIYGHGAQEFVKFFSVCLPIVDLVPGKTNRKKIFIVSFSFQKRDIQLSLHIYMCVGQSRYLCLGQGYNIRTGGVGFVIWVWQLQVFRIYDFKIVFIVRSDFVGNIGFGFFFRILQFQSIFSVWFYFSKFINIFKYIYG